MDYFIGHLESHAGKCSVEVGFPMKEKSRPQIPPSHEEKWSGEPNRISWASVHFCDSVT